MERVNLAEKKYNRLQKEKSPYLLQHAQNPVEWYGWSDEAFDKAKTEDKPIFLSIGYSTCHWCHVMAHQSFEDEEVAKVLNEKFIAIKVDREERPDIDSVYMDVCQAFTGSGGWPASIFMDGDKRPFFAGTYYPKESFMQLLNMLSFIWTNERDKINQQAQQIIDSINSEKDIDHNADSENADSENVDSENADSENVGLKNMDSENADSENVGLKNTDSENVGLKNASLKNADWENADKKALKILMGNFEPEYGGFSEAPKFPTPHNLLFLIDCYEQTSDSNALKMCKKTLTAMREGGIFDHAGGGFSRYSTDRKWLVPHFEKMLYDNALLMIAYARAFEITENRIYAETVFETAQYLTRDLMNKEGAFYTAEDADSEGREGLFYLFSKHEIDGILGSDALVFGRYYNITANGNFEGQNILNTINVKIPDDMKEFIRRCLSKLFEYRLARKRPHRDEKILAGQNGLAIAAFAVAGRIFKNESYIRNAEAALNFILEYLSDGNGRLFSMFKEGHGKSLAFAEDYAYLCAGLLELYKASGEKEYLFKAEQFQAILFEDFYDEANGGFFHTSNTSEKLILRKKELYDGATPSYNSVIMNNLFDLYLHTKEQRYLKALSKTLKYFAQDLAKYPHAFIHSITLIQKIKSYLPELKICDESACRPAPKNLIEFLALV